MATNDARLVALDARNGKIVWETRIADSAKGYLNSSGPIVINGKVIQGLGGCDEYNEAGCYISAYDAATGKQLWKFYTVAREGTPGGDTWGKLPNLFRAGGDTWITGSYDPDLDLTYWGVAQPKPWLPVSRGLTVFDKALYTSSTLALRPDDGHARLVRSAHPGRGARPRRGLRACARRHRRPEGRLLGRQVGHPLEARSPNRASSSDQKEMVFQNVYDSIDPKTGAVQLPERHHRGARSISGLRRVRAPRAARTGRR